MIVGTVVGVVDEVGAVELSLEVFGSVVVFTPAPVQVGSIGEDGIVLELLEGGGYLSGAGIGGRSGHGLPYSMKKVALQLGHEQPFTS